MKIKLLGLSEAEIEKGFEVDKVYTVDKVEISGDMYAYDIWYLCQGSFFHSIMVEEVKGDIRVEKIIKYIDKMTDDNLKNEICFKFKYDIDLKDYSEDTWIVCSNEEGLIINTENYEEASVEYETAKSGLQFIVDNNGIFNCDEVAILGKVFRRYHVVPTEDDVAGESLEYEEDILCDSYDAEDVKWLVWDDEDGISTITDSYEEALNDYSKYVQGANEYTDRSGEIYEETQIILARIYNHFYSKKIGISEEDDCEIWDFQEDILN